MKIKVKPLGLLSRSVSFAVSQTVNRVLAGRAFLESPQETHAWTYRRLTQYEQSSLNPKMMALHLSDPSQCDSHYSGFPLCHAPILGGWKNYYVLEPDYCLDWYVGWIVEGQGFVSRILLDYNVRMLGGNKDTRWFAITEDGQQKKLYSLYKGTIGDGSRHSRIRLL